MGAVIWFARYATNRRAKGTIHGRLSGALILLIVVWGFIATANTGAAGELAAATAHGTGTAAAGIAQFISDVFR
jgi:hypothetical protein